MSSARTIEMLELSAVQLNSVFWWRDKRRREECWGGLDSKMKPLIMERLNVGRSVLSLGSFFSSWVYNYETCGFVIKLVFFSSNHVIWEQVVRNRLYFCFLNILKLIKYQKINKLIN